MNIPKIKVKTPTLADTGRLIIAILAVTLVTNELIDHHYAAAARRLDVAQQSIDKLTYDEIMDCQKQKSNDGQVECLIHKAETK